MTSESKLWLGAPRVLGALITTAVVCILMATAAISVALHADTKANHVAVAQAHLAQQQTADVQRQQATLQDAFCGLFRPIAAAPLPPNVSDFGKTISVQSGHAVTVLSCPPAPK